MKDYLDDGDLLSFFPFHLAFLSKYLMMIFHSVYEFAQLFADYQQYKNRPLQGQFAFFLLFQDQALLRK